ncbi:hypothetical protein AMJ44_07635 [candidate division WOR-1 bacterium DG_54_3]|uniref:Uncharacterized protein n=1 Tax=candidate division WOR-1 bacterium DG_54_3 TaxID=1703775 RepID=A0A0S7XX16_UNCSA|nr:MAG: hypothetical protein AMJ44_07635 [candidate division WOR-1 bacterium DG_54_3]
MTTIQEIKKRKKVRVADKAQKVKTKKKVRVTDANEKTKTAEITPISKYKEWKLLYAPYPFRNTGNNISPMTGSQDTFIAEEKDSGRYKGLCRNCEKRENCMLPKPEGGVWRCEEYE